MGPQGHQAPPPSAPGFQGDLHTDAECGVCQGSPVSCRQDCHVAPRLSHGEGLTACHLDQGPFPLWCMNPCECSGGETQGEGPVWDAGNETLLPPLFRSECLFSALSGDPRASAPVLVVSNGRRLFTLSQRQIIPPRMERRYFKSSAWTRKHHSAIPNPDEPRLIRDHQRQAKESDGLLCFPPSIRVFYF